jgi:hypothetical protein
MRALLLFLFATVPAFAAEPEPFIVKPGEFPPEGSAHYIAGELIALDHVNRTGVLRPDRTDAQLRGDWDRPHEFTLLPFGSLRYHGAPAELRDIPLGTHLHGWFYLNGPQPRPVKGKPVAPARGGAGGAFHLCSSLEDDFSYCQNLKRNWRIDAVDLEKNILTVTGITDGKPDAKATAFQFTATTRVWKGKGFGALADLSPGQSVLLNLTVCTLKGPGRVTNLWLDAESREVATTHQRNVHRQFIKEHGLPGWVEEVDHERGSMTVVLFAGFDPELAKDFVVNENTTAAVAEDNLRTWDQINDRKVGSLLKINSGKAEGLGNSGVRVTVKPALLLEGFRPKRVVRLWAGSWKVDDLPREERLYQ